MTFCWEEKDATGALCDLGSPQDLVLPSEHSAQHKILTEFSLLLQRYLPTRHLQLRFLLHPRPQLCTYCERQQPRREVCYCLKETKLLVDVVGPFQVVSPNLGEQYKAGK